MAQKPKRKKYKKIIPRKGCKQSTRDKKKKYLLCKLWTLVQIFGTAYGPLSTILGSLFGTEPGRTLKHCIEPFNTIRKKIKGRKGKSRIDGSEERFKWNFIFL